MATKTMNWDKIAGHKDKVALLKGMLRKIPHALLFSGAKGIGKMFCAQVFAAAILCSAPKEKPCGICPSCLAYGRGQHPDFIVVRPESANVKETIKIDQIRALKRFALLSPALTEERVCIIEDAQTLTTQAANSLLKLLEEPPPYFYFILVASNSQPLLPTILSRSLLLNFSPLSPPVLAEKLMAARAVDYQTALAAANLSGGCLEKALKLTEPEGFFLRDKALKYLELLADGKMTAEFWDSLVLSSRQETRLFLEYVCALVRDLLVEVITRNKETKHNKETKFFLLNHDLTEKISRLAWHWDEEGLFAAHKNLRAAIRAVTANANIRLTLDALTIKFKNLGSVYMSKKI